MDNVRLNGNSLSRILQSAIEEINNDIDRDNGLYRNIGYAATRHPMPRMRYNQGGGGNPAGTSFTGEIPNDLPRLRFHAVRGENVRVSQDGFTAKRVSQDSFTARREAYKGIAFSARPVRVNEKVYIRFIETSNNWNHLDIVFGFTKYDPNDIVLPHNAISLSNKPGYWVKYLVEFCEKDNVLHYFINPAGDVHFGINGEDKGLFLSGVDTRSPLWMIIDLCAGCTVVKFTDHRALNQIRRSSPSPVEGGSVSGIRSLSFSEALPQPRYQNRLMPLTLHRTKGRNVQFTSDRGVVSRMPAKYCQAYVFTARPMPPGQTILIQILCTEPRYSGSLAIGLTSCDPATLRPNDLPDDAEKLLDRPEYWVVHRDAADDLRRGDELAVTLTLDGEVKASQKGCNPMTVMHVDNTVPLWAFVELCGATKRVKMFSTRVDQPAQTSSNSVNVQVSNNHAENLRLDQNVTETECGVCYENPKDSALYKCGHRFCYMCAVQLWKGEGGGRCPVCRQQIKDVLRTY